MVVPLLNAEEHVTDTIVPLTDALEIVLEVPDSVIVKAEGGGLLAASVSDIVICTTVGVALAT
jgi:hypothetical protein